MKIEILNPIIHDGVLFDRGLREVDDKLAELFLNLTARGEKPGYAARKYVPPVVETAPASGAPKAEKPIKAPKAAAS